MLLKLDHVIYVENTWVLLPKELAAWRSSRLAPFPATSKPHEP